MTPELLRLLRCPYSGSPLRLEALVPGGRVEQGILRSEAGEFPLVAGIPILLEEATR